jgi:DNA-binding response OmpR family regulator
MLSAKAQKEDKFWGRDAGADDYITKPFDPLELERVVTQILELREVGGGYHPLTKLPTHPSVEREIARRKEAKESFAVCEFRFPRGAIHVFQQKYGGLKWEELLAASANILREQAEQWGGNSCFLGHRGESTLVVVGPPESLERIGKAVREEVGKTISLYYDEEDLARGYVLRGEEKHPLLSLSQSLSQPS